MKCSCSNIWTPMMESTGMVDSSNTVTECMKIARDIRVSPVCSRGVVLSARECSAICRSARHSDQFNDLGKSFEMVSDTLCRQFEDDTLSKKGASIIMQSLVQHGLMKLECRSSSMQKNEDELHQQRQLGFTDQQLIHTESRQYGDLEDSHLTMGTLTHRIYEHG
ncbi:uncharacterized protein [Ptychodera flava]|uniref:uncharacterized protein n=1 Tax=Ptychodera flava TaxID=63121 RepID=UPI00396A1125